MKRCPECSCMVTPGILCWNCGKLIATDFNARESVKIKLESQFQKFVGKKLDDATVAAIAKEYKDFENEIWDQGEI